jgi:hypothetical protein
MPHHPRKSPAGGNGDGAEPSPGGGLSASARAEQDLVARAVQKVVARQELSRREREALKRHEKDQEEKRRWQYYETVPQKHWRRMSGRQAKVLIEQQDRYGIDFGGAVVNLPKVVKQIHDFLADNAIKLAKDDDLLMQGSGSPALEDYRRERAAMAKWDRLEREGVLLPRDQVREALGRWASIIRAAGDALQRQFGAAAAEILFEALDDSDRDMDRYFGGNTDGGTGNDNHDPETPDAG